MSDIWNSDLNSLRSHAPSHILSWLRYSKCVTKYCKQYSLKYELNVIEQYIDLKTNLFIRDTISFINDAPAILARTKMTCRAYKQFKEILDHLDDKPIGENLLFREGNTRSAFAYHIISPDSIDCNKSLYKYITGNKYIFARKSTFYVKSHEIELQENFLPSISHQAPIC
jgi:chorismate-pyruvate lyase